MVFVFQDKGSDTLKERFGVGIHWIEYTVPEGLVVDTIEELDEYYDNEFVLTGSSMYGYRNMFAGRGGSIILCDERRKEHHVILPGHWLTEIGEASNALVSYIFDNHYKCTRVDIACDDYSESPKPSDVRDFCEQGQLVTRFRRRANLQSYGVRGGVTVYIGSMKSRRYLRIYDKTKETKGNIKATRWEVVLRDEYADQTLIMILTSNLNDAFLRVLLSMVEFRVPTTEERESRRQWMPWFREFVGDVKKAQYIRYEPARTLSQMEHWLQKQVSRTLAKVVLAKNGDLGFVYELLDEGKKKILRRR